jgi:hypothetical protein
VKGPTAAAPPRPTCEVVTTLQHAVTAMHLRWRHCGRLAEEETPQEGREGSAPRAREGNRTGRPPRAGEEGEEEGPRLVVAPGRRLGLRLPRAHTGPGHDQPLRWHVLGEKRIDRGCAPRANRVPRRRRQICRTQTPTALDLHPHIPRLCTFAHDPPRPPDLRVRSVGRRAEPRGLPDSMPLHRHRRTLRPRGTHACR